MKNYTVKISILDEDNKEKSSISLTSELIDDVKKYHFIDIFEELLPVLLEKAEKN